MGIWKIPIKNLWILFWEENEILWNEDNQEQMTNSMELLSSTVRDTLYVQLNIIDEEKSYANSIIDKSIERTLDKVIDIKKIDKTTVKIIKK